MVIAIEGIDRIAKDPFVYKYIEDAFGGIDTLKKSLPQPPPLISSTRLTFTFQRF